MNIVRIVQPRLERPRTALNLAGAINIVFKQQKLESLMQKNSLAQLNTYTLFSQLFFWSISLDLKY